MMAPARKSRSIYKKYPYINEESPSKDGDGAKRSNTRKRKLSDMLGHRWTTEELTRFYDAYRKHGKDWKKVAGAVRNRSSEMVETLYTMNRVATTNAHSRMNFATYQLTRHSQPNSLAQNQSKEADIHALAELTRALDKKEAIVLELRRMNDDVSENQKDGCSSLKDSDSFKKQYAAVLVKLNETNEQVYSAIHCLRDRNTYQGNSMMTWPRPSFNLADRAAMLSFFETSACETIKSDTHVNEITDNSRSKAQTMVNAAMQAISSLMVKEGTFEKIEEAIDYVNDQLPSDDSSMTVATDHKTINASDIDAQIPSELITTCIATLLMIQKCTER